MVNRELIQLTERDDRIRVRTAQRPQSSPPVHGDDDIAAAAALAWALMPGACTLANRMRTLDWYIDEIVAAQLWVEVRTFPWRRLRKVAANVLLNTRTGVLRDCDAKSQLERTDLAWSRPCPVDPYGTFWGGYASTHP